ncbi:MAG TPA: hypothetical protein VFZ59_01705 [Verrucomicrobiae bacterium]|nr:hypothetical protein [Verrucomicrobiae bacterium]
MTGAPQQFTAAQIASALGMKRQAVQWHLRNVSASGSVIVSGVEASAWSIQVLPETLRNRLEVEALQRGYRSAAAMLTTPPLTWPPKDFPKLDDITPEEIEKATKLRKALGPSLYGQHDVTLSSAEFESRGVAEYARVFGHGISARYWRALFKRTLQRDGGEDKLNRLELYLSDKPALKLPPVRAAVKVTAQFAQLTDYLDCISDPTKPSDIELRGVWSLAFEIYGRLVEQGTPDKRAARHVRSFLFSRASFLAPTRNALRMAFDRKLETFVASHADPNSLKDGRVNNGEKFEFPEEDKDLLTHRAVFYYRGDVAPAWRDCLRSGFSQLLRDRYAGKSTDKSHVPASVMELVGPEVDILTVMHRGRRAFDSIKGHVSRNYDGIASLRCLQADDFTLNTYFFVPRWPWMVQSHSRPSHPVH